ncbi:MAG TPA: NAD(P)-binding domain-containing protein [Bryobacteraceae bacterium]|nr:NAD(P)-binding domain-containing protein [Bryobacteraceae bacterium]
MDTLITFLVASMLTFYFVRRYLKTLSAPKRGAHGAAAGPALPAAAAKSSIGCPRCGKSIPRESTFCPGCGAPMSLWNVHRAAVKSAEQGEAGETGKPRPVINATLCIGCGTCVDSCPETGTLALMNGKAILAHPERCVGHAKCVEVCPTSALSLAFGSTLQTLRAPLVKESFETNVPGIYIAGELSGMGLIKTAINEGRLAVDNIRRKLEAAGEWAPPVVGHGAFPEISPAGGDANEAPVDVLIVGAGPAGLSASLAALQNGLRYLTLEQGEVASTIRNYPRHKFLMAEPVEMPLYGSLYVGDGTKESLLSVWETILANTGVQVKTQECVQSILREGAVLKVTTARSEYRAKNVILALGKRGTPRRLGIPGEELAKVAYRLIEADSYADKDILIVGGGDSAIEASLALSKASRNRVTLSYRGEQFDRARDRNKRMLQEAEQQGRVRILRKSQVMKILANTVQLAVSGQEIILPNHYVFVLIGGESPDGFLRKIGIQIVEKVIGAEAVYETVA